MLPTRWAISHLWSLAALSLLCNANVGAEIAGVLHLTNGYENASSTGTTNASHPVTGTGYAFAESCQAALRSWSTASIDYGRSHNSTSTSYFTSEMTLRSHLQGTTEINSLVTLCDGHPRVVGRTTASEGAVITSIETWTNTNPSVIITGFPTPKPCSIGPEDCKSLYSSWTSHYSLLTKTHPNAALLDPPCRTHTAPRPTYSTNSKGGSCDNCLVIGSKIRLLYWPFITKAGSDNLCNGSAITVTTAPTGSGPNTVVTDGVTITSPSVAVSIGGLSRVDQCGTVVPHTIIPVLPKDVSSVEGARALFTHKPFNFANLNYRCLSDPKTIFMTTGSRDDCYQEVPASDYFLGYANAAGANWMQPGVFAGSTIWPNYQPQVLPPETLTHAIRSIWGNNCYIHPDGVWDPPIALTKETDIPAPEAGCTTITYLTPTSTPAIPAPSVGQPSPTGTWTATNGHSTKPGIIVPTISSVPQGPHHESVVHSTLLTIDNKAAAGVFTIMHVSGEVAMVNDFTTMAIDPQSAGAGSAAAQVITLASGQYSVEQLQGGAMRVVGASTTISLDGRSGTTAKKTTIRGTKVQQSTTTVGQEATATQQGNGNGPSPSSGAGNTVLPLTSCSLLLFGALVLAL